ncbi:MAG: hypothetical protein Q4B48_06460 [Syntrophomonadaceae bacterium]|nr:hypothetical protein [Syntrophomonadaceae bacterium]
MQQRRRTAYRIAVSGGLLLCCVLLGWLNRYELPLLPLYWHTEDKIGLHDLNYDGREEKYELKNLGFMVTEPGDAASDFAFSTPPSWKVTDYLTGDIDRDGVEELLLLVWKQGSFGEHRPFWIEEDDPAYSQHLFIYKWEQGRLQPIWMSSALYPQIAAWEPVARPDGSIALLLTAPEGEVGEEWVWGNWGIERAESD